MTRVTRVTQDDWDDHENWDEYGDQGDLGWLGLLGMTGLTWMTCLVFFQLLKKVFVASQVKLAASFCLIAKYRLPFTLKMSIKKAQNRLKLCMEKKALSNFP